MSAEGMIPCLKQVTRCVIVRADGRRYEATNACHVEGLPTCPRVTAGCATGTGYELCGSTHAEANAAALAAESADIPGEAYLYGHTWLCGPCQHALTAVNVRTFHVVAELVEHPRVEPCHGARTGPSDTWGRVAMNELAEAGNP